MEKNIYRSGPKEEYQACFVRYFGCYVCDLLNAFDAFFLFQ